VHHEDDLRIDPLEHRLCGAQPGDHPWGLLADAGARLRALGHDRARREVTGADVLGERALDQVAHRAATASRSMPAAA
jgi:hypothetical protein